MQASTAIHTATTALELTGLTSVEVQHRRASGQGNTPPPPSGRSYRQIIRENVFTFINICLFGLGLCLVALGRPTDALVSLGVISSNLVVSIFQEVRAKRTLDKIALLNRPMATVIRDGQAQTVPPENLVVGDLLKLSPGDQVVLDGRVVGEGRMTVDESQLTGESNPLTKQAGDPVYSGSFCVTGSGLYIAEKVGAQSLSNQITAGARAFRRVLTPLQREINLVIQITLLIVAYFEFLLFLNAVIKQIPLVESVQNSTVLAGLVPNGLFLSISVAYAVAAVRLIRYGALVQQSNAIESLSNVDTLCLDKTGTLTANRLQVHGVWPLTGNETELQGVLGDMVANTTAANKTSEAIAAAYPGEKRPTLTEIPFSSARKWSAVAFDDGARSGVYALGASEMLRPYLGPAGEVDSSTWETIETHSRALTDQGLRVLLVAHYPDPTTLHNADDDSGLPNGMTPLGLVSLSDELRPEARETLAAFIQAGVQPKIISGDNPETVAALARQAGLGSDVHLISGLELEKMDDLQFRAAASAGVIFGRITPQQKERLVKALREQGRYVAMIGDGVNDVLSLKQANLGIAMQSGSQATRSVADVVLLHDSFAALLPAVVEGQRILNGMQDILRIFLTRISTVGLIILSSLVIGIFPFQLRSMSLITLLTVGIPTIALALFAQPGHRDRKRLMGQLANFVVPPMLLSSIIGLLLFYGAIAEWLWSAGLLVDGVAAEVFAQSLEVAVRNAQTTLTYFLTFTGLFLIIFVEPPTPWWTGGDDLSGDLRPTWLALTLMLTVVSIGLYPPLRDLFALVPLSWFEAAELILALVIWLFTLRFVWRRNLLTRFIGMA